MGGFNFTFCKAENFIMTAGHYFAVSEASDFTKNYESSNSYSKLRKYFFDPRGWIRKPVKKTFRGNVFRAWIYCAVSSSEAAKGGQQVLRVDACNPPPPEIAVLRQKIGDFYLFTILYSLLSNSPGRFLESNK